MGGARFIGDGRRHRCGHRTARALCGAVALGVLLSARPADAEEPPEGEYGAVAVAKPAADEAVSSLELDSEELAAVPLRTAEDALRLAPGLVSVQHGSEGKSPQFFLRGFDAEHGADLEIVLEGMPLNEWSNVHAQGYLDLAFMPPELIREVRVVKGPFAAWQGPFAVAGSASYELGVAPAELGTRVSYTTGTTGRQRALASYSPTGSDGTQLVAVELLHEPGFGARRRAQRAALLGRIHLVDDPARGRLSLLTIGYAARFGLPSMVRPLDLERGNLSFDGSPYDAGQGRSARGLALLTYELLRGRHTLEASAFGGYRELTLRENFTGDLLARTDDDPATDSDARRQRQHAVPFGARAMYAHDLHPNLRLAGHAGLRGDVLEVRDHQLDLDGRRVAARKSLQGVQLASHVALGLSAKLAKDLRLDGAARLDVVSVRVRDQVAPGRVGRGSLAAVSPRVRASYRPGPALRLVAAYGRGVRPPEARAFIPMRTGEPAPGFPGTVRARITQSHTVELGARITSGPHFALDLSSFATLIEREQIFDHVSGANIELGATRRLGAEAVVRSMPLHWLRIMLDATGVDARLSATAHRVPLAPWLTSGARIVLVHPGGAHAGLRFLALAPRPLPGGERSDAFYLLDATAGYRYRVLRIDLALENLLFRKLREAEYRFASHWYPDDPLPLSTGEAPMPTKQFVAGPPFNARLTVALVL